CRQCAAADRRFPWPAHRRVRPSFPPSLSSLRPSPCRLLSRTPLPRHPPCVRRIRPCRPSVPARPCRRSSRRLPCRSLRLPPSFPVLRSYLPLPRSHPDASRPRPAAFPAHRPTRALALRLPLQFPLVLNEPLSVPRLCPTLPPRKWRDDRGKTVCPRSGVFSHPLPVFRCPRHS